MSQILWALFRPVLGEVLRAVIDGVTRYMRERQDAKDRVALGRALAEAEAARNALAASERMAGVELPGDDEVIADLEKGTA